MDDIKREVVRSLIVISAVWPLNVVHEIGHVFVCILYGNEYSVMLSLFGNSNTVCFGDGFGDGLGVFVYRLSGGMLVTLILLVCLLILGVKIGVGTKVGIYSLILISSVHGLFEGLFFDYYISNVSQSGVVLGVVLVFVVVMQWVVIVRRSNL
mgnify:FL=1